MKKDIPLVPTAEAKIEFHGRKAVKVKMNLDLLPHYIEEILVNHYCPALLAMGFISKEESLAYFDITDAYPLKKVWQSWKSENRRVDLSGNCLELTMIELFLKIIEAIDLIENFLFVNSGFCLDWEYIFFVSKGARYTIGRNDFEGRGKALKLAFVPQENESLAFSSNLSYKIIKLIEDSLGIVEDEDWHYCGKQLMKLIQSEDSLQDVSRKLNQMAREISSRDWPDLSSLRQF